MKKNFSPEYLPADLRITKQGWYILFYQTNPVTGKRQRFRNTFDLNRIKDKKLRKLRAAQIIQEINTLLPFGYPFKASFNKEKHMPLLEAFDMAHTVKCQTDRKRTAQMYDSIKRIFTEFVGQKGLVHYSISEFSGKEAMQFMDWLVLERKIGPRTYNNYLIRLKSIFNALIEREHIYENPFSKIKKKPQPEKKRRTFTNEEKQIVATYIRENDPWLYLGLLLQYYCYIRPIELRRLRFKHFNLKQGTIHMPSDITKNKKQRNVTIPAIIMDYFQEEAFTKWPLDYLIFGVGMLPHPDKSCSHNTMNYRHKQILEKLERVGEFKGYYGSFFL